MFTIDRKILFVLFALILFVIGAEINSIFEKGIDNPVFDYALIITSVISAVYLFSRIYKTEN